MTSISFSMVSLQPYDDVPPIELGYGSFMTDPLTSTFHPEELDRYWHSTDAQLDPQRSATSHDMDPSSYLVSMERHLRDLANSANGCTPASTRQILESASSRLELGCPWVYGDQYRNQRYLSLSGLSGGSFSSTESGPSECAFSLDASRYPANLFAEACTTYSMTAYDIPYSNGHGDWTPQPMYVLESPACSQSTACNMKDLQYTPDPSSEEDLFRDFVTVEAHHPTDAALSSESDRFTDEGLGRSVLDAAFEEGVEDADNRDSEIDASYPSKRRQRKMSHTARRVGSRTPKTLRFIGPSKDGVLGQEPRVLKPSRPNSSTTKVSRSSISSKPQKRTFICSFAHYGCRSTFGSKNEWKRHVASQHLQLGFYRCDTGACSPENPKSTNRSYNDFNRKDLFTQHHRRMHTPWSSASRESTARAGGDFEKSLEVIRQRSWVDKRKAPERSNCGFCRRVFEGNSSWDERMEHVGKHYEKTDLEDDVEEQEDEDLRDWALREGILEDLGVHGVWLLGLAPGHTTARNRMKQYDEEVDDRNAEGEDE